jgi:hypothetical protein
VSSSIRRRSAGDEPDRELTYQTFDVHDAPGQQLLVGTPPPGSRSEEAVAYPSSMAAPT